MKHFHPTYREGAFIRPNRELVFQTAGEADKTALELYGEDGGWRACSCWAGDPEKMAIRAAADPTKRISVALW